MISGGDSTGTLYAAYRFAEHLGVRFYLHGDTIPDQRIRLAISELDERGKPLFDMRGIQPFHDFPEGPDWWNSDDYGPDYMHGMNPWTKLSNDRANELFDCMADTLKAAFGYAHVLGIKTCVGTETPLIIPNAVKERITSIGKDPNNPAVVQELYEGMFQRIVRAYPLDYYWFWTPEGWTWGNPKDEQVEATLADFRAAIAATEKVNAPFTLATCGWVLGPPKDQALFDNSLPKEMPMSCINRNVGFAPVEPGFARVQGRPKWAIPWLEDDPALTIPQLWAGRMRRDAADALAYGCTGLMGIHWRTRILGPNISALAHAAWEQKAWNPDFGKAVEPPEPKLTEGREGGNVAQFPNNTIADTENDPLYQTVIWDIKAYRLKVSNGTYTVTLKFCEPHYDAVDKRIFRVELQGKRVIDSLDVFAEVGKDRALDYTFEDVKVKNGLLAIRFDPIVEFPFIAAFIIQGEGVTRKINCGGPVYKDYEADIPETASDSRPRDLPTDDFYADWALTQFGPEVAQPLVKFFTSLDGGPSAAERGQRGANLPRPATWVNGPGGITPDERPWEQVSKEYTFVEEMAGWRSRVKGPGNLERFDYWLNRFRYLRAIGKVNCTWARYNAAMKQVKNEKDLTARKRLAQEMALPIRKELVASVAEVYSVSIQADEIETDLEYYIKASWAEGRQATFPATAPEIAQTVVLLGTE